MTIREETSKKGFRFIESCFERKKANVMISTDNGLEPFCEFSSDTKHSQLDYSTVCKELGKMRTPVDLERLVQSASHLKYINAADLPSLF